MFRAEEGAGASAGEPLMDRHGTLQHAPRWQDAAGVLLRAGGGDVSDSALQGRLCLSCGT